MSDFDNALRRSLSADDEAFLRNLEDRGLFGQMGAMFEGPMKFWTIYAFVLSFAFFIATLFAFWKALDAETARETMLWGVGALWFALAVAMIKMWWWMRMNHLATLRELKKIELRLAQLGDAR